MQMLSVDPRLIADNAIGEVTLLPEWPVSHDVRLVALHGRDDGAVVVILLEQPSDLDAVLATSLRTLYALIPTVTLSKLATTSPAP